jgi:cyclophilin family peptidyl-prolyl cis-trans isomerase
MMVVAPSKSDSRQPSSSEKLRPSLRPSLIVIALTTLLVLVTIVVALSRKTQSESPPAVVTTRLQTMPTSFLRRGRAVPQQPNANEEVKSVVQLQVEMEIQAQKLLETITQLEQLVQERINISSSDFNSQTMQMVPEDPAPYRVQVQVSMDNTFVLEINSAQEMPPTVHHFLEMVEDGFWDGATLVYGMGVQSVHAIPKNSRGDAQQEKVASTSTSTSSGGYPNEKYSVCFSNQKGPEFYINLQDNTKDNDDDVSSCFAKVVQGFHVLDTTGGGSAAGGYDNLLDNMRFFKIQQMMRVV